MKDSIYRQAALDAVHMAIFDFFDICSDNDESPITYKDEQLLELNKSITKRIQALPSAVPENVRCKDCKNWNTDWESRWGGNWNYCPMIDLVTDENFYCEDAERKEDATN